MNHQCRPIDLHAPGLYPYQLVLQENRETVGGWSWRAGLRHTPASLGSLQIYIYTHLKKCVRILCGRAAAISALPSCCVKHNSSFPPHFPRFNINSWLPVEKQYVVDILSFLLNQVVASALQVHPGNFVSSSRGKKRAFSLQKRCDE